jgi:hypothetical protein
MAKCECGRDIDGSRNLAASHFERCSVCRRARRSSAPKPGLRVPPEICLAIRQQAFREVIEKIDTEGWHLASAELRTWLELRAGHTTTGG